MFAEKMGAKVVDDSMGFRGKTNSDRVLVYAYDDLLEMRWEVEQNHRGLKYNGSFRESLMLMTF